MKQLLLLCALLLPLSCWAADAKPASTSINKAIRGALSDMSIKAIYKTPIPGLYEVQSGDVIYYTDRTGKHLINGHMFDTAAKQDLTAERLTELTRINWSDLPLDKAIVSGPENGLKMAVFTDPDCPYCKRLESTLANIDGLRVYTFLYPLTQLHPDAYAKSESIWCAKDQHQAMIDVMTKGTQLPKATCQTPIADIQSLAQSLNVRGTPTIFSSHGRKYSGNPAQIKAWLELGK